MLKQILLEVKNQNDQLLHDKIVEFFKHNDHPSDMDVHHFAESLGLHPDKLEEMIYTMFSRLLRNIGKHNDVSDNEFDKKQLDMGVRVEMEHTNDKNIAKMIAKDHLKEMPDYYTKLKAMEAGTE